VGLCTLTLEWGERQSDTMSTQATLESGPGNAPALDRVVAGFDGSPGSVAAVEWAACEAVARGSSLHVVTWSDALIDEATHGDLLVIGSSRPGATMAMLHGSVAGTATRRSPCTVVVVRGERTRPIRRIVVAVDGSSAADAAADWACDEADRHGADLLVVHAREDGVSREEAQCIVNLAVNECRERTRSIVSGIVVEGSASKALIDASREADLLSLGSRGRSGFRTLLFGSVALFVTEHADCPVAVTHPRIRWSRAAEPAN
jgi:nucleotide-binding universal stress UspA family protein